MVDAEIEERIEQSLRAGALEHAVSEGIRGYGPRIVGYLRTVLRDEDVAQEAFSDFCEHVWSGAPSFRRESSFLTWAYRIAWSAAQRRHADPFARRRMTFASTLASRLADEVRSSTSAREKSALFDALSSIRETLTPEDQTLLVLRVEQGLAWRDVALVLSTDAGDVAEATLRKRFERLRARIREALRRRGREGPPI
jgi:RNA polymerase sigma-70 factor (ECF subfamily)